MTSLWRKLTGWGADRDLASHRDDMEEEMRFHLDMAVARFIRAGHGEPEARRMALATFGGVARHQEGAADDRRGAWLDVLTQDVRYGLRTFVRNPGFTAAVCATIALGIAGTAAMFSIVYGVLLRPLPVPHPEQLTYVGWNFGGGQAFPSLTGYQFDFLRRNARGLAGAAAFQQVTVDLSSDGTPDKASALRVSPEFFAVLQHAPVRGRGFVAEEFQSSASPIAVISDGLWRREFAADSNILSRTLAVGRSKLRIVGVMPPSFHMPGIAPAVDILVPLRLAPDVHDESHDYDVMARRAPATSAEALREELVRLSQGLRAAQPQLFGKPDESFVSMGFQDVYVSALVKRLWLLFAAVACLLLAACVNSANLWVARAVARRHEMTIRVAIGASRSRVLRQLITESVLVSALAGTIGLLLGWWGLHALLAHAPTAIPRVEEISFFPAVLLSGAIGTIVAVAFGLLGAAPSFRAGLASALGQRTLAGARGGARVRAGLLVTETALAVLLVCAAGLLVTSFYKLMTVDKGFSSAGVWSFAFARLPSDYDAARRQSFAETYLQRVRSLPGVTAAGALSNLPLQRGVNYPVTRDGRDDISEGGTELRMVTPGAIEALSIRLRYGRTIAEADLSTSAHVALVNESLARQFFGTANVVGQRLDVGRWKGQWLSPGYHAGTEIIGVVSDVRDIALDKRPRLTVYLPQPAGADGPPTIVASIAAGTSGRGAATPKQIADLARGIDSSVSPPVVRPLAEIVGASVAVQRYQTTLLVVLGALSVLLAVVGIFGITAYAVQVRAREISVRMALGANSASLIQLILGGAMRLVLVGVALGLGLAVGASRLLEANLFGVSATQPSVLAAAGGLMIVTAVGACVAPARRALRLQPAEALRL